MPMPTLNWERGEVLPAITCLALMAQPTADAIRAEEKEMWEDVEVLRFLQTHQYGNGLSAFNKDRIYRRTKSSCWMGDNLFRLQIGGEMVVVPRPKERIQLALDAHKALGHFGFTTCWIGCNATTSGGAWVIHL